jgi:hypothetical protein
MAVLQTIMYTPAPAMDSQVHLGKDTVRTVDLAAELIGMATTGMQSQASYCLAPTGKRPRDLTEPDEAFIAIEEKAAKVTREFRPLPTHNAAMMPTPEFVKQERAAHAKFSGVQVSDNASSYFRLPSAVSSLHDLCMALSAIPRVCVAATNHAATFLVRIAAHIPLCESIGSHSSDTGLVSCVATRTCDVMTCYSLASSSPSFMLYSCDRTGTVTCPLPLNVMHILLIVSEVQHSRAPDHAGDEAG